MSAVLQGKTTEGRLTATAGVEQLLLTKTPKERSQASCFACRDMVDRHRVATRVDIRSRATREPTHSIPNREAMVVSSRSATSLTAS